MLKNHRIIFVTASLFALEAAVLACSLGTSEPVTPTPAAATEPGRTPTAEQPEPKGEITPVKVNPACVTNQVGASLGAFTYVTLPQAIVAFLNSGGSPEELDSALKAAAFGNQPVAATAADLNGDSKQDVVASVFNPASSRMPPASTLAIFVCQNDQYVLHYSESQEKNAHIWMAMDLDDDKAAEVLLSWAACGAHTCFEDFQILGWQDGNFVNRMEGSAAELPYPNAVVQDEDGDRVFEVVITAAGIGSVGAGPQRNVTYTWHLRQEATMWTLADTQLGVSTYRIHIIHDADSAARQGDYERAVEMYLQAINDPTLKDWMEPEVEKTNLQAYARYKLVALLLMQGQEQLSAQIYDELQAEAPAGSRSSSYAAMAEAFRVAYDQEGEEFACQAVQAYAEDNPGAVLDPLNAFGYANPVYTAPDMCP